MAFSKVGPHYDNGNEVLVYIRRLNGDTPPPGNWSSFDYYVMAALPTNDNPRYSVYNVPDDFSYNTQDGYYQNQDILTERYYKYKFGPSDIKYQTGPYPPAYGTVASIGNETNTELLLRVEFPPTGDGRIVYRSLLQDLRDQDNNIITYSSGTFNYFDSFTDLNPIKEKSSLSLTLTEFDATGGYLSTGPQFKFDVRVNFWNAAQDEETIPRIPSRPKGAVDVKLLNQAYKTPIIAQIKLMPSGSKDKTVGKYPVFYHYFNAETGKLGYDYIPYRRYQIPDLKTPSQDLVPPSINPALDFISYTGLPVITFRYNLTNGAVAMSEEEFNKLPPISLYIPAKSGWTMPQTVDQVGQIKMQDTKNKITYTDYKMAYPPTYRYLTFESLEFNQWEQRWTLKADEKDNDPIFITSGVTEYLGGSQVWDNEFVKRRNAGPQNRGLPLHELNSTTNPQHSPRMHFQGVDCKATHLAYKIGAAGTSATVEHVNYAGKDNNNEIIYANNPAVLLFNNSSSFYKRLPECWPWSCRRWTVESSVSGNIKPGGSSTYTLTINYFTQNQKGEKIKVGYGDIPTVNIGFSSFTGEGETKNLPILNGDPFPKLDTDNYTGGTTTVGYATSGSSTFTYTSKIKSTPSIAYSDRMSYFNGYYFDKVQIKKLSDVNKLACGCNLDDVKVELAAEIFPLLHNAECKLIMKMGYLCYPSGCNVPNIGTAVKKIMYPFNACKFNDALSLPLPKLKFPDVEIDWNSITLLESDLVTVCYAVVPDYTKAGSVSDQDHSKVALMLHGNNLSDNSINALPIQVYGNAGISKGNSRFGGASVYVDGEGGYVSINSKNNALDLSKSNFTFEFAAFPKVTPNEKNIVFSYGPFSFEGYYTNNEWVITMSNNSLSNQVTMTCPVSLELWQNIAIVRKDDKVSLFKNGKIQTSQVFTKSLMTFNKPLVLGDPNKTQSAKVYLDEFRVTKGVARYDSENYIPTSSPFPDTATSSLDPCTFVDSTTVSVSDQDQFLKFPDATGYIMMIAKRPCAYTSDIQVYKTKDNDISFVTGIPFNEIHNCPTEFLGRVHILGNGTDFPEPSANIVTGGDYYVKSGEHVNFNRCDRPYFSEIYKSQSLGNAGGFIDFQVHCCDYCGVESTNSDGSKGSALVSPAHTALGNCSALDIEGTPLSIPQSIEAGGCLYQDRKLCINHTILGKAKLKCISNMIGDTPNDPMEFPCTGEIPWANGIVTVPIYGESQLNWELIMDAAGTLIGG